MPRAKCPEEMIKIWILNTMEWNGQQLEIEELLETSTPRDILSGFKAFLSWNTQYEENLIILNNMMDFWSKKEKELDHTFIVKRATTYNTLPFEKGNNFTIPYARPVVSNLLSTKSQPGHQTSVKTIDTLDSPHHLEIEELLETSTPKDILNWCKDFLSWNTHNQKQHMEKMIENMEDMCKHVLTKNIQHRLYNEENLIILNDMMDFCCTRNVSFEITDLIESLSSHWFFVVRDLEITEREEKDVAEKQAILQSLYQKRCGKTENNLNKKMKCIHCSSSTSGCHYDERCANTKRKSIFEDGSKLKMKRISNPNMLP